MKPFKSCSRCLRLLGNVKSDHQEIVNTALKEIEKLRDPHRDESFGKTHGTEATECLRFLLGEFMKMTNDSDWRIRWKGLRGIIKIHFTHAFDEREREMADLFLKTIIDERLCVRRAAVDAFGYLRPFEAPKGYVNFFYERTPFQPFSEDDYVNLYVEMQNTLDRNWKKRRYITKALEYLWMPDLEKLMEKRGYYPTENDNRKTFAQ